MNHQHRLLTLSAGFLGLCAPAFASSTGYDLTPPEFKAAAPQPQSSGEWIFTLKPYLWAAAITGEIDFQNALPSEDVYASFGDILDNLNVAGMLAFEARQGDGDVAFLGDFIYMQLEDDGGNVDVTLDEFMGEVDVAIRPWEPKWLEALAGMRYWNIRGELDPSGPADASKTADWIDPVIGARATFHPFNERCTSQIRGDIGGFNMGSKSSYQVMSDLQYAFSPNLSGVVGYRVVNFDYEADHADYDLTMYGPWIGLNWSF